MPETRLREVAEELLHGPVAPSRLSAWTHERGVAQPAVAVVPVARVSGASGIDVVSAATIAPVSSYAELQRDRRADHRVLPLERNRRLRTQRASSAGSLEASAGPFSTGSSSSPSSGPRMNVSEVSTSKAARFEARA